MANNGTNSSDAARAFLSYVHDDDETLGGSITWLRELLERTLKAITGKPFPIFQDKSGISLGEHWPSRLEETLKTARFLIPILTPSYFNSEACRHEAELFFDYEKAESREDLVLPIYLIEADILEGAALRQGDPLARRLHLRQRADWREIAFDLQGTPDISKRIKDLADQINEADKRDRASIPPLIAEQRTGVQFWVNEEGLIDRAKSELPEVDDQDKQMLVKRDGLIDAADRFLGGFDESQHNNSARSLIETVQGYREAISGPLSRIDFADVWRFGSRMQNAADAYKRNIQRMELPDLEDRQQAALDDLIDEHGPFVYETRTGRAEQEKADRFKATQAEQQARWQENTEYQAAVIAKAALFSDEAKAIVTEVNNPDEEPEGSQHPERGLMIAETTNQNLLSVVGKVATGSKVGAGLANANKSTKNAATGFLLDSEPVLKKIVASSSSARAWFSKMIGWLRNSDEGFVDEGLGRIGTLRAGDSLLSRPAGTVFRDLYWSPEMVVIPPGSFMMGSPEDEAERRDSEGPQHRVTIEKPFALGRYPVTFDEFDRFCDETNREKPDDMGWGRGVYPVFNVTCYDAEAYCAWLSKITGWLYRLPRHC